MVLRGGCHHGRSPRLFLTVVVIGIILLLTSPLQLVSAIHVTSKLVPVSLLKRSGCTSSFHRFSQDIDKLNDNKLMAVKADSSNDNESSSSQIKPGKRFAWIPNDLKNGLASGLAAILVKIILQPFDTIKTVQHVQTGTKLSAVQAARAIIARNGFSGLWSGISITVIGSSPSVALYFAVYGRLKKLFTSPQQATYERLLSISASAAIANTIASAARVPYEVLKHRIQIGQHAGIWEALTYSVQQEGIFGLFTGGKYFSQVCRDVPYAVVCILSYEIAQSQLKKLAESSSLPQEPTVSGHTLPKTPAGVLQSVLSTNFNNMLCGAIAGGCGAIITNPMDVIMTRTMTARKEPFLAKLNPDLYGTGAKAATSSQLPTITSVPVVKTSQAGLYTLWHVANGIVRNEGWNAFTTGVAANVMHKVPANALFFLWYENIRSILDTDNEA
jgi:hypothetical protein